MAYLALARKWRPKAFSEVVGQSHVVQALSNALDSGRVHHAFLFTGTRGVGKTTLARIFAKSLNCEKGTSAEPCQECSTCQSIDEGRFVDLIEVDAASRTKVDDTRELLENVQYAPTSGKFKVYLIDEVHMLSGHSFNALLKTLEEPPEHVKFLFATTDPQKLPVTVLSRCLQFNLRAMRPEQVENQLVKILSSEAMDYEPAALNAISKAADGSMRDGLSLLDQAIAQGGGSVCLADVQSMLGTIKAEHTEAIVNALVANDVNQLMKVIGDMSDHSVDFETALDELLMQLYYISLAQMAPAALSDSAVNEDHIKTLAEKLEPQTVQLYYQIGLISKRDISLAPSLRVGFEMAILRMLAFEPHDGQPSNGQPSNGQPSNGEPSEPLSSLSQSNLPQSNHLSADVSPTQEPVQQTPVQQAPVQQTPVQQTPVQQTPAQQTPVQQTPVQQTPVQQTPVQQTPVQQTPVQQTPAQQAPAQQAPAQQAPAQQAPVQQAPVQQAPVQQTPVQQTPVQQTPVQQTPVQQAPVQQAPVQQAPVQQAPANVPSAVAPSAVAPSAIAPSAIAPSAIAPSAIAPSAIAPSAIAVTLAGNNEWGEMVEQTALVGLSKELAMNCACEKMSDEKIVLALSPSLHHLFKAERVGDIQEAIRAITNKPVEIELEVEQSDRETPAECLQRLGYEQLEQAKENLQNDPGVKAIMSEFGATINEHSIKTI